MHAPVTVRPVESFEEYLAGGRVVRLAWRAAFDDILPASALPAAETPPDRRDRLESTYEELTANDAVFVAEWDGRDAAGSDGAETGSADAETGSAETGSDDPDIVGFAHVVRDVDRTKSFVADGDAELRALYVRPDRWGEGVGSALLARVESAVRGGEDRSRAADSVRLRTFAANEAGRAFYRARGFDAVGDGAYDVDGESYPAVVLAKPVGGSETEQAERAGDEADGEERDPAFD